MTPIAITNVRVFDGSKLSPLRTVILEGGLIAHRTEAREGDTVVDGQGGTLLPGLIDSHVHVEKLEHLEANARWGVTTVLDMATRMSVINGYRNRRGLPEVRATGSPASGPGGIATKNLGHPLDTELTDPDDAVRFINERLAEKTDFIKVILEDPERMGAAAMGADTVRALVTEAHRHGKLVFAHASAVPAWQIGIDAGVDILTHIPLGPVLPAHQIEAVIRNAIRSVPTLIMMKGIAACFNLPFAPALISAKALFDAGVPVAAGTDANTSAGSPSQVPHGEGLHEELALLVEAGLTPAHALNAATRIPADLFGLSDRGVVESGKRADLLLVDGDPTADIAATRNIRSVWISGVQVR